MSRGEDRDDIRRALRDRRVAFMDVALAVGPGALVPRHETELLGKSAVEAVRAIGAGAKVIDVCCGAGNLACAVAHHVPGARVWATDLTTPCVELTRANVAALGLAERVSVHQGDLFAGLESLGLEGGIDVVVCNPPYISEKRLAEDRATLLDLEPAEAFAAGPYGIAIHQRVVRDALRYLRAGGVLLVEIGAGQQRQVEMLFKRAREYTDIVGICDDAGEPRVVSARRVAVTTQQGEAG